MAAAIKKISDRCRTNQTFTGINFRDPGQCTEVLSSDTTLRALLGPKTTYPHLDSCRCKAGSTRHSPTNADQCYSCGHFSKVASDKVPYRQRAHPIVSHREATCGLVVMAWRRPPLTEKQLNTAVLLPHDATYHCSFYFLGPHT